MSALFVSTAGSNTAGDGSQSNPWATIQFAADRAQAGDVVNIAAGTYNEVVTVSRSGTAANPITFCKAPGAPGVVNVTSGGLAANLRPSHANFNGVINVTGDHLVFDGIDIRGTADNPGSTFFGYALRGTDANRVENVTVRNVTTVNTYGSGIYAARVDGAYLYGNSIENACKSNDAAVNSQECITVAEVDGFEIIGNRIWSDGLVVASNGGEGIDAKGSSRNGVISDNVVRDLNREIGIYLDSGSRQGTDPAVDARPMENIVVTRNTVYNSSAGVIIASERGGTVRNVDITNNLVYDNGEHGIALVQYADSGWPESNGPREDILIANNTVVGNGFRVGGSNWGGGINVTTANVDDIRIINNIVSGNESWQIALQETDEPLVMNNLSWGKMGSSWWNPTLGLNGLYADPGYINALTHDFGLLSTSAAIDLGTWTGAPTVDLLGNARTGLPDAGAFEYAPVPEPATAAAVLVVALCGALRRSRSADARRRSSTHAG